MALKLQEKLDRFPPVICRLLARHKDGGRVVAWRTEEIASRAKMSPAEIMLLSQRVSWDGVPVDTMLRFTTACDIDLDDHLCIKRKLDHLAKLQSTLPRFLIKSPEWESTLKHLVAIAAQPPNED